LRALMPHPSFVGGGQSALAFQHLLTFQHLLLTTAFRSCSNAKRAIDSPRLGLVVMRVSASVSTFNLAQQRRRARLQGFRSIRVERLAALDLFEDVGANHQRAFDVAKHGQCRTVAISFPRRLVSTSKRAVRVHRTTLVMTGEDGSHTLTLACVLE